MDTLCARLLIALLCAFGASEVLAGCNSPATSWEPATTLCTFESEARAWRDARSADGWCRYVLGRPDAYASNVVDETQAGVFKRTAGRCDSASGAWSMGPLYLATAYYQQQDPEQQCPHQVGHVTVAGPITNTSEVGETFCATTGCLMQTVGKPGATCFNGTCYQNVEITVVGTTCNGAPADPSPPEPEDEEVCTDTGGGYSQCLDDGEICVRTPMGGRYCWTPAPTPAVRCQGNTACVEHMPGGGPRPPNDDPETVWEPSPPLEFEGTDEQGRGYDWSIYVWSGEADDDSDGEGNEDDDDDDGDGVDDDTDNDEETQTASLPGCGGGLPACSDPGSLECQHYRVAWQHRCDTHGASAGGGATCEAPPTCTHVDPVQCAQLKQLWRIRCDSDQKIRGGDKCDRPIECERASSTACHAAKQLFRIQCDANPIVAGGESCASLIQCNDGSAVCRQLKLQQQTMCALESQDQGVGIASSACEPANQPACSKGDQIGCAILRQQWLAHCQAKVIANALTEDVTTQLAEIDGPQQSDEDDALFTGPGGGGFGYDDLEGGWAERGSCPVNIEFNIGLGSFQASPTLLCDLLDALADLVFLAGLVVSGFVLAGGRK